MGFLHLSEPELVDYAEGDLSPGRMLAIKEHLGRCSVCAVSLARMREAASAVGALRQVVVPEELHARIAAAVRAEVPLITCREAAPMLHELLDRRLAPLASVPLQQHLDSCPKCRTELTALTAAARLVRALPEVTAPAGVRQRVNIAIRTSRQRTPAVLVWRPALAAAGVMLVVGALALLKPTPQTETKFAARGPAVSASPQPAPVEVAAIRPEAAPAEVAAFGVEGQPAESAVLATEMEPTIGPAPVRPTLVVHTARIEPKGPVPARTVPERLTAQAVMPAAFTALQSVAKNASYETEVQRAMEMAGERFATLRSEAVLEANIASLPGPPLEGLTDLGGDSGSERHGATEDIGSPQPNSSSTPRREGASLLAGPFV